MYGNYRVGNFLREIYLKGESCSKAVWFYKLHSPEEAEFQATPQFVMDREPKQGKKNWLVIAAVAIVLIVAISAVIALAVALAVVVEEDDDSSSGGDTGTGTGGEEEDGVRRTGDGVELTNLVLIGLDPSVDPCEDFNNFTSGAWMELENTGIPESACLTVAESTCLTVAACTV